jgi:hypothetical protein
MNTQTFYDKLNYYAKNDFLIKNLISLSPDEIICTPRQAFYLISFINNQDDNELICLSKKIIKINIKTVKFKKQLLDG